jgi:hypothetical protein
LFVRVRVPYGRGRSLLVPDDAVLSDQRGRYVLVVGEHDVVEQRPVEVGPIDARLRVIASGLTPDDRVVVRGLQRARPGFPVKPSLEEIPAATPSPDVAATAIPSAAAAAR